MNDVDVGVVWGDRMAFLTGCVDLGCIRGVGGLAISLFFVAFVAGGDVAFGQGAVHLRRGKTSQTFEAAVLFGVDKLDAAVSVMEALMIKTSGGGWGLLGKKKHGKREQKQGDKRKEFHTGLHFIVLPLQISPP